ncbi:glycosyltransferase [Lysobacter sp. S4-A87]|uniref:glycosyltransferase n=1 Tax=Lysobacter sp. S4-A87 TaxID=2925843 RepID=UPI001F52CD14|nr:glycosyltransferase [Lysobacter sp. S4-A87]UNK49561.1 glycosyltransferase [Lysobacter sp. S4-A87]
MNILMLSDVYFPRINGVSTSIRTFAQALARMGHTITLVAPDYGTDHQARDDGNEGFEILRLPSRKIFFDPEDRLIKGHDLAKAEAALCEREWDVIHIHTPFRAHTLGVRLARHGGWPTVETYHTYFEEYVGHYLPWLPSPLTRLLARRASRHLCHGVDELIVPSAQMLEVLDRYGVTTPSTVIPTGIDLDQFSNGDGARFRAAHGISPERPTLVTVSRLSLEKNIGFLLQVVRRLVAAFSDLLFLIAGEGPDEPRLRRLVQELGLQGHVRFFGNLDRRTTLLDAYRAGDAFVFASPTETQGLVLIEAMALGVPIVSTAVMGTATVLRDAASAVVAQEDVDDFARQVARVLRSPEMRAQLSSAGPADARAWGADGMARRVETLYVRLAQQAHLVPLTS